MKKTEGLNLKTIDIERVKDYETVYVVSFYHGYVLGCKYNVEKINTMTSEILVGTHYFETAEAAEMLAKHLNSEESANKSEYYNIHANEYVENTKNLKMDHFYDLIESHTQKGSTLLDLGFGSGRDMINLINRGYNVYGIDFSEKLVEIAKENPLLKDNVTQDNLSRLSSFDKNSIDLAFSVGVLMHLSKKERLAFFNRIKTILKPNGVLILSYNESDRTNDDQRLFCKISRNEISFEAGMTLLKRVVFADSAKRDMKWITDIYINDQLL